MTDPRLRLLVQRLHDKGLEGSVPWEKGLDEGIFQASFRDYSIKILRQPTRHHTGDPDEEDIVLQIFNEKGELIEEVDDTSFKIGDFGPVYPFPFMAEIHAMARRAVMGVNKAVDSILEQLEV